MVVIDFQSGHMDTLSCDVRVTLVSWPVGKVLWSTTCTSACAIVPGSSRVRPLTPDSAPKLGTSCLKAKGRTNKKRNRDVLHNVTANLGGF